ncbi:hypothetical protein RJ639_007493 [Escallonia herrerae]|uniref:Uncharacterized protein n=1 Tax=Escallonia herrerae TaxID=1293975 RepID=A0AA89AUK3_9ASTE|nr:hypothetical protein RJ639_007493 [Escallonia herrerae]
MDMERRFHGLVRGPESKTSHAKLRITDLSDNGFAGKLPLKQLVSQATNSKERFPIPSDYLKGLRTLNLSNNSLIRLIPPSLENLMELESLNLSDNKLPGEIPQQLTLLTFLSFLNVSTETLWYRNVGIRKGKLENYKKPDKLDASKVIVASMRYGSGLLVGFVTAQKCGNSEGKTGKLRSRINWTQVNTSNANPKILLCKAARNAKSSRGIQKT